MKDPTGESAGSFIREHMDGELEGQKYVESRKRFVEAALASRKQERRLPVHWAAWTAGFATATVVAVFVFHSLRAPITFSVGPTRASGAVSEYIVSPWLPSAL